MNRLKGFSASAELAVCCVVLLLAVALSAPLWLGFVGTVQARPDAGLTGMVVSYTPLLLTGQISRRGMAGIY